MENDEKKVIVPMGISSLITILVTVIILLFTVITISQVSNEKILTEKTVEGITQYYQAENKAELKLADINNFLNKYSYTEFKKESLNLKIDIINSENTDEIIVEYKENINNYKELLVRVKFNLIDKTYQKLSWKIVSL